MIRTIKTRWKWPALILLLLMLGVGLLYRYWPGDCEAVSQETKPTPPGIRWEIELIEPGTVVGDVPPKGWSHLVIKTKPRVGAGDVDALPKLGHRLASMLVTTVVADVQRDPSRDERPYFIRRVGVGVGMNVNGKDVILSPTTARKLGANPGIIGYAVLVTAYNRQKDCRLAGRTRTMAVMDTPTTLRHNDENKTMKLRYALLVDPQTGKLASLVWSIDLDPKGNYQEALGPIEHLASNTFDPCILHVDKKELSALGLPSERAFAALSVPKGITRFHIPTNLQTIAGTRDLDDTMTRKLESRLRDALQ